MLGQVFNIGVQLFFILSGFLTGYKGIQRPYAAWYRKRARRIYIPYWLFLISLAGIHLVRGMNICNTDWLLLWIGAQGSNVGVWGAGQTWFISALLLCYLTSPAILFVNQWLIKRDNKKVNISLGALVCALPLIYASAEAEWVYTLLNPISLYSLACVYGANYQKNSGYPRTNKQLIVCCAMIAVAFGARFVARGTIDGTIWYDRIVVPYTHMIAASAIWVIFEILFAERNIPKPVQLISDISFEIYLWHYMFVVGPISVFALLGNWGVACIVVTMIVFMLSLVSSKISTYLSKISLKK